MCPVPDSERASERAAAVLLRGKLPYLGGVAIEPSIVMVVLLSDNLYTHLEPRRCLVFLQEAISRRKTIVGFLSHSVCYRVK
ncbi:hypothetical protein NHJ13734_007858 [Beauveria thailandica]